MSHFRKDFRVPRLRALRAVFTRRGLVLRLNIETDGDLVATIDTNPPPKQSPKWHKPEETWR